MTPKRIQRRRVRGWRLPENAVCVTRPGVFGNPFKVDKNTTAAAAVRGFRNFLNGSAILLQTDPTARKRRERLLARLPELVGKDLACYCPVDAKHCHADVLLEAAAKLAKGAAA